MKKRRKGKRGRGLPRRAPRCRLADVREDGQAVRAPTKGAAASPFDGGALTRVGSACAGEGAINGAMFFPCLSVAHCGCAAGRRKERCEEREQRVKNEIRVWGAASAGVLFRRNDRTDGRLRRARAAAWLCRPRPRLRPGCGQRACKGAGPGGFCRFGREPVKIEPSFFLFCFPINVYFWKMKNVSKKIEEM